MNGHIYRERKRSGSGKQESLTWQRGSSKAFFREDAEKESGLFLEREDLATQDSV